jgi:hypothetical protein
MEEPFLYKSDEPIHWTISQILDLCRLAIEQGAADEFASEADAQGIRVMVPRETINFTKRFIFHKRLYQTNDGLKGIVQSAHCVGVVRQPDYNPYKHLPTEETPDGGAGG